MAWRGTWCEPRSEQTELVTSISIDDVVDGLTQRSTSLILKLDVEGAELQALQGLRKHIPDFEMIIYEDHGKEPTARVTAEMLRLGFLVFTSDRVGNVAPVESVDTRGASSEAGNLVITFLRCATVQLSPLRDPSHQRRPHDAVTGSNRRGVSGGTLMRPRFPGAATLAHGHATGSTALRRSSYSVGVSKSSD